MNSCTYKRQYVGLKLSQGVCCEKIQKISLVLSDNCSLYLNFDHHQNSGSRLLRLVTAMRVETIARVYELSLYMHCHSKEILSLAVYVKRIAPSTTPCSSLLKIQLQAKLFFLSLLL